MAMKVYRQVTYRDFVFSLEGYQEQIAPFQKADLAFQANEFSRWEEAQKSNFIASLLTGRAPSKFVFADVQKCLEFANERGNIEDAKYFQKWLDRDVLYLNIDSNNRNNVITDFTDNRVSIPHGKYEIDGMMILVDQHSDTYDTMPETLKHVFHQSLISVTIYTDVTREELSEIFINLNDGKPLNNAEILNAYITPVADVVRDLAMKYGQYFIKQSKWFGKVAVNRRGIDDFIAGMAYAYAYGLDSGITNSSLQYFYREGSDGERQMPSFRKAFDDFMKNVMTENAYAIANRNSVFDLFILYVEMRNEGRVITDNEKFLKGYIAAVAKLLQKKERYEHKEFKDPKSFDTMIGGRQKVNNILRNQLIKESFDYISLSESRDKNRGYNAKEKMILAAKGDFKTPEGKEIKMSRLHTADYHGGHVMPYSKTGKTTLDNGVIQTAEDNLKLGAKPLELEDS